MRFTKYLFILSIIVLVGCKSQKITKNNVQNELEFSIPFLDNVGVDCEYDFQYYYKGNIELEAHQEYMIHQISRDVVGQIAGNYELIVLISEMDSIEKTITNDITIKLAEYEIIGDSIKIDNLIVAKKLYELLILKEVNVERVRPKE